jgi:hypothetical protein
MATRGDDETPKATVREVRCPSCGRPSPWSPDNAWRPFCSARCKQIDLGAWASEAYRVPVVESDQNRNQDSDEEPGEKPGPA